MSRARLRWLAIAAAILLPLAFAAFTQHAWEDYFITLRSSRNLVEGNGLVFNPGERVHTFTSPLGVLVPALCTAIAGPAREALALWLFRLLNIALLGAAAALLWRRTQTLRLGPVGLVTLFGLLFADTKLVDFSTNGMETAMLVYFVLLLWSELERMAPGVAEAVRLSRPGFGETLTRSATTEAHPEGPRAAPLAVAFGGLMWTRPDAFVIAGSLILAHVVVRGPGRPRAPIAWSSLFRGAVLGGALYVPWFAWAWWYYGSPVPHTIIAKGAYTPPVHLGSLLLIPWQTLTGHSMMLDLFLPTYWPFGGWPTALPHVAHALVGIAAFAWLVPKFSAPARRASLALFVGMFYVCSIVLFPWYIPPWTALGAIALGFVADELYAGAVAIGGRAWAILIRTACLAVVVLQLAVLAASAWQMRHEQRLVETGVRRAIGEWLHAQAKRGDTVFLEPLGYIGYFSQLKTYDFPGLSSPEVVAAVRAGARRYADIIGRLRPTWVVLRPHEAARPEFASTGVLKDYTLVKSWDATPQLDQIAFLPGRPWVEAEAQFLVFHQKTLPK